MPTDENLLEDVMQLFYLFIYLCLKEYFKFPVKAWERRNLIKKK